MILFAYRSVAAGARARHRCGRPARGPRPDPRRHAAGLSRQPGALAGGQPRADVGGVLDWVADNHYVRLHAEHGLLRPARPGSAAAAGRARPGTRRLEAWLAGIAADAGAARAGVHRRGRGRRHPRRLLDGAGAGRAPGPGRRRRARFRPARVRDQRRLRRLARRCDLRGPDREPARRAATQADGAARWTRSRHDHSRPRRARAAPRLPLARPSPSCCSPTCSSSSCRAVPERSRGRARESVRGRLGRLRGGGWFARPFRALWADAPACAACRTCTSTARWSRPASD